MFNEQTDEISVNLRKTPVFRDAEELNAIVDKFSELRLSGAKGKVGELTARACEELGYQPPAFSGDIYRWAQQVGRKLPKGKTGGSKPKPRPEPRFATIEVAEPQSKPQPAKEDHVTILVGSASRIEQLLAATRG